MFEQRHNYNHDSSELARLFKAGTNEQYGRHNDVGIFGVKENANKDVYQEVITVVRPASVKY